MYIIFEGGGVEFEPKFHGMFDNLGLAKEHIKNILMKFLKDFMLPHEDLEESNVIVEKKYFENYTYFYIYQDKDEQEYGAYMNVFILVEVK
jgi:hypothetical protein